VSASVEATIDDGAGEGATPLLSLAGYHGALDALLTLARGQNINLATISVLELVDQLAAALRDAPAATPLAQKADWLVMAAWLLQLRSRLLLPADAAAHRVAEAAAHRFRDRLAALAEVQALASWLEDRPLLGHDVFGRGHFENMEPVNETASGIDVIEFLWASMALFGDGPVEDVSDSYRPPSREWYSVAEARARILQRLSGTTDGLPLDHLLPDEAATEEKPTLRKRSACASTLIAGLELAKQGEVCLAQTELFGVVHVSSSAKPPD
jgi:segregation and condensation protein A